MIITRVIGPNAKGSALTKEELDTNFLELSDNTNTTYAVITGAEITTGTATDLRTISGATAKLIADRNVGTDNPVMNGAVAVGVSLLYSRQDHVHPVDTSRAASTHSHTIANISDSTRWWNNFGNNHSTQTSFDATTPSYGFGWRFIQGSTNGPGTVGTQFYSLYTGLGNDYAATGAGSYGMQIAIDRNVTGPYLSVRYNENNSLSTWRKIRAGYADSAGTAGTATDATKLPLAGGTMTGLLSTYVRADTFISSNDGNLSVRGNTTYPAVMAFHRAGAYAVKFGLDTDNHLKMGGWSATSVRHTWQNNGNYLATGSVTAYASDTRLKTNFKPISNAVDKVMSIGGYEFDWDITKCKDLGFEPTNTHEHGVKAQEIQKVIPDAVSLAPFDVGQDENNQQCSKSGEDYLTVRYERIVPLLIEAIKEQQAQIDELKNLLLNKQIEKSICG